MRGSGPYLMRIAIESLSEVDAICLMIDATMEPLSGERNPARFLERGETPVILLLNKIDRIKKEKLLPLIETYGALYPFRAIIPLSAICGDGVNLLREELLPLLPVGPRLYPEDIPTDQTERFIVAEIIREKVFLQTSREVPYSTAVTVDNFKEDPQKNLVTIHATIIVEKNSQKGIIIGKQGAMLRSIGAEARKDIETLLDSRVFLKLFVKVQKNWSRDERFLKELGF
ncbi:MAG: GTPase Era [Deltaproteobacteria bacterium]